MNPLYYYGHDFLMKAKQWAIDTHEVTPGFSPISFNGFPHKEKWFKFFIGAIGEFAYSDFSGLPFDWEHRYRFTVLDFPDGAQVKSTTAQELVIPMYEWDKNQHPRFYVLALVRLFDTEEPFYAKVELAGKTTREEAEKQKIVCKLPNVGNKSWQVERKYLHHVGMPYWQRKHHGEGNLERL
jgi:hypothetical protein